MHSLILLAATTPSPSPTVPTLRAGLTDDQIGPGFLGFLAMAFIVVIMFFLIRDMVKRVRRVRYRAQVEDNAAGGSHGPDSKYLPFPLAIPIVRDDAGRSTAAKGTDTLEPQTADPSKPDTEKPDAGADTDEL